MKPIDEVIKKYNLIEKPKVKVVEKPKVKEIIKKDKRGNIIYKRFSNGYECWSEYDKNGNIIHYKTADGYECWNEYDKNGNEIYYKNSKGYERWREYDKGGVILTRELIHYSDAPWELDGVEYIKKEVEE
jgi:YD repeat-containing protein